MSNINKMNKGLGYICLYVFLIGVFIFAIFPVIYAFLASFKSTAEILTTSVNLIPKKFLVANYIEAWKMASFGRYTWNSIYMSFIVVIATIVTSTMCGYVFSRGEFPGKGLIFGVFTSTMFISLGSIGLFPLLGIAKFLGIHDSLWGVIIIKVFGVNIANIYLVKSYLNSVSKEIDEAAVIDGCGFFRIYWNIIFPLLKPIVATVGLLTFRETWNDYLLPMVFTMTNLDQAPLTVGIISLKNSGTVASAWNLMLAGTMISVLPLVIVYLFLNRYFVAGLTNGAVKG